MANSFAPDDYHMLWSALIVKAKFHFTHSKNKIKQAGAELGQAQLPIGIGLYCD